MDEAMSQPMDRRQFLVRSGMVVLAVAGVTSMLRSLGVAPKEGLSKRGGTAGYGSSPYGGQREGR